MSSPDAPKPPPESNDSKPVYVSLVKNGALTQKTYTLQEAKAKGIFDAHSYAFLDNGLPSHQHKGAQVCPRCGYTQYDFEHNGRLGCAHCASVFTKPLQALIEQMHKGSRHRGKIPASKAQSIHLQREEETLQAQLSAAIEQEDFEQAATLRDRIAQINKRLHSLD